MEAVENIQPVPEPQWILDRSGSGPLYWRRESPDSRVKFRFDVEVKEFERSPHELEDAERPQYSHDTSALTMGLTCLLCIAVTAMLPWYMIANA